MRPISWMAKNHVAANLLMIFLLIGGLFKLGSMKQEIFPNIDVDEVTISIAYPGASPSEVVEGVVLVTEDAVSSIEWAEKVKSYASEGLARITVELADGADRQIALQDIKSEIDRVTTYPDESEDPIVSLRSRKRTVVDVTLHGNLPELELRHYGDMLKDKLLESKEITLVDYLGVVKDREIRVKIRESQLRKYSLTLSDVANKISKISVDLPLGSIDKTSGELVLRMKDKRYNAMDFRDIPVISSTSSGTVYLKDIAEIVEGFEDVDVVHRFNGEPGISFFVYRVGEQSPNGISAAVSDVVDEMRLKIPKGVSITVWDDDSLLLKSRLDLLKKNAILGLILVVTILAVFLELRLALWVALGIPISFLGAILILPSLGISINMISSFAFILALGIVVDDAIVVGENIYTHRMMGKSRYQAAVDGTSEVLGAVTFSVLTTVTAFLPILYVEGRLKALMSVIPYVVISVLLLSLIESFFILPAHLNGKERKEKLERRGLGVRQAIRRGLDYLINDIYGEFLRKAIGYRYVVIAIFMGALVVTLGAIKSGNMKFRFMPSVERDVVSVKVAMPAGTHTDKIQRVIKRIEKASVKTDKILVEETDFDKSYIKNTLVYSGSGSSAEIYIILLPPEERDLGAKAFEKRLRKTVGRIPGVESITFSSSGLRFGSNIDVRFAHEDEDTIVAVSEAMKRKLASYDGVIDIEDSFDKGKRELTFKVNELGKKYGLNSDEVGRQVRAAFYGVEAVKFQRGLDEVSVRVEYAEEDKKNSENLMNMYIKTSSGMEIPFYRIAEISYSEGLASINRSDRKQVVNVTASAINQANPAEIMRDLEESILPELMSTYPGLSWKYEGEEERRRESMGGLLSFLPVALLIMYALLAIPFKSYVQPFIVLLAIPFGLAGAIWGHMMLGMSLSIMSVFGMVAVAGVVVNDSLVLVDFINKYVKSGELNAESITEAGKRRFRPILMTSLTTFFGLTPMILEKSIHAQFLIPMAVSLAFGVMFTTFVALVLVPCIYMAVEDIKKGVKAYIEY